MNRLIFCLAFCIAGLQSTLFGQPLPPSPFSVLPKASTNHQLDYAAFKSLDFGPNPTVTSEVLSSNLLTLKWNQVDAGYYYLLSSDNVKNWKRFTLQIRNGKYTVQLPVQNAHSSFVGLERRWPAATLAWSGRGGARFRVYAGFWTGTNGWFTNFESTNSWSVLSNLPGVGPYAIAVSTLTSNAESSLSQKIKWDPE